NDYQLQQKNGAGVQPPEKAPTITVTEDPKTHQTVVDKMTFYKMESNGQFSTVQADKNGNTTQVTRPDGSTVDIKYQNQNGHQVVQSVTSSDKSLDIKYDTS